MSLTKPKKPKMLVVDDEPDNLDLLYRTFRRDFQVLRSESGAEALTLLSTEGEVAVIISDQRMPEMKGTEFLSKTVPNFPDTIRIILTGFTDVEDLVEAINSGQVYKYITKPWDPNELKTVVQQAAETYNILKQRTEELHRAQAQMILMQAIVQVTQVSDNLENSLKIIAQAFGDSFCADNCIVQIVEDDRLIETKGTYTKSESITNSLENDPLVQDAIASLAAGIATHQIQSWVNIPGETVPAVAEYYQNTNIQVHLIVPIISHSKLLAFLSLQWQDKDRQIAEEDLKLIHLSAQQIGLAITSTKKG
ncbi:response regulator [Limnofasciculus baicalensis]|uniref:Response regulator n=1 Tax=Limnofasciculus baicalensis BBK-W-15 TaxID=2699891 RepID=A0AAE3GWN3_9CYAN|nr:response regulator [Limnofasciculus baicalensis]MCP2731133.1 response regulator [Limnofasciculus baicalensis BBK-W-15]